MQTQIHTNPPININPQKIIDGLFFEFKKIYWRGISRFTKPTCREPIQGIPNGLDRDILDRLCLEQLKEPLIEVSYTHLSSWKDEGTYRLSLKTENRTWRVIYKNSSYSLEHIAGLDGFNINFGASEFSIYQQGKKQLADYIPDVYLCTEIVPNKHYQYLLEDLGNQYRRIYPNDANAMLKVVVELCQLNTIVSQLEPDRCLPNILNYDQNFAMTLQTYAQNMLEKYVQTTGDIKTWNLLRLWPKICKILSSKEVWASRRVSLIHGDLNFSNVLLSQDSKTIKVVDWEWAGWGTPHTDLAFFLQLVSPTVEEQALTLFAHHHQEMTYAAHKRLYSWCKLEREILNASFCAVEFMRLSTHLGKINLPRFVEISIARALKAYKDLN